MTNHESAEPPQPVYITYQAGMPVNEVVRNPAPPRLTEKEMRKAATSERIQQETRDGRNEIDRLLLFYGQNGIPSGDPERSWSSLRINEDYLNAYVSGFFGRPEHRLNGYGEEQAHIDALHVAAGWQRPALESVSAQPAPVQAVAACPEDAHVCGSMIGGTKYVPASTSASAMATGAVSNAQMNAAYVAYVLNPDGARGDLRRRCTPSQVGTRG